MSKIKSIKDVVTYVDVDSTFRDRQKYPNPADFRVECTPKRDRNEIRQAYNIISNAYPYYQWQWGCIGTGTDGTGQATIVSTITGDSLVGSLSELSLSDALTAPTDSSVDSISSNFVSSSSNVNYFTGLKIQIDTHGTTDKTQQARIIKHDSVENIISLSSALSGGGASDFLLETSDWSITNSSTSSKIFIPGGSSKDGHYVGDYYECLMYGGSPIDSTINTTGGSIGAGHTGTIGVSSDPRTIFFVGSNVYLSDGTLVGKVTANASGTITISGGTLVVLNNSDLYHFPNPTVHQFRQITKYDGYTKLATLESALSFFDNTNGSANKSGDQSTTYVHRLRKGIPILPSGSSAAIGTDNIALVQGTANVGALARVSIFNGGSGYVVGEVITISGGTNGKILVDNIDGNGKVTKLSLLRSGSGYSASSNVSTTGGSGTGLKINIVEVGTGINIHTANGVSTTKNTYKDKVLYYPAFASGGGTANTDPSAAQDFIPQNNTVNVDSPNTAYNDSDHCSFHIIAHNYYAGDGINEVVIKSMSSTQSGYFVANKEFNILDYKEDGVKQMVNNTYLDPKTLNNYYEIHLMNLTLPNSALRTGPGGFLANHSYIMVEFFSDSYDRTQIYNTNNPQLENVMFKCMILDTSNPNTIPFLKFKGSYPVISQFKLNENVTFRILMPNGEVLRTTRSDRVPPMIPDKDLQVSATFMLKRVDLDK